MRRVVSSVPRPGRAVSTALAVGLLAAAPAAPAATEGLTVSQPWMRFLTPGVPAAGYFTLRNSGARPAVLTGAASPACGQLMLHQSVVENGTAHMTMVMSVAVPAHGTVKFQPGGYHLMCIQPSAELRPKHSVPVSLQFKDGRSVSVAFPVYGAKGK